MHCVHQVFCVWHAQTHEQTCNPWHAWHRFKQNATKDHMVAAMPSDRSHLPLVEGTRSWRKVCHRDSCSFPNECDKIRNDSLHMPPGPAETCMSTSFHAMGKSCLGSICCIVPMVYSLCNFSLQKVEPCAVLSCVVLPSNFYLLTVACMHHLQMCSHAFTRFL